MYLTNVKEVHLNGIFGIHVTVQQFTVQLGFEKKYLEPFTWSYNTVTHKRFLRGNLLQVCLLWTQLIS